MTDERMYVGARSIRHHISGTFRRNYILLPQSFSHWSYLFGLFSHAYCWTGFAQHSLVLVQGLVGSGQECMHNCIHYVAE